MAWTNNDRNTDPGTMFPPTRGVVPAGPPVIITSPLLKVSRKFRGTQYEEENHFLSKHTINNGFLNTDTYQQRFSLIFADQIAVREDLAFSEYCVPSQYFVDTSSRLEAKHVAAEIPIVVMSYSARARCSLRSRQGSSPAQICYFVILTMPRVSCVTFSLSENWESKHGFISIYQ